MWFDPSMDDLWEEIIKPGCEAAGYLSKRVVDKQFNGDIDDGIIAGIKESAFVIADLSSYRGGVYYEAGFAEGLGKTVILMCLEGWFHGDGDKGQSVHFDLNHQNTIIWNISEIDRHRKALTDRIRATVGMGPYKRESI